MWVHVQIKTDNSLAYASRKMKQFCAYYNINPITGIPNSPTAQVVRERFSYTFKDVLNKEKGVIKTFRFRLHNALLI